MDLKQYNDRLIIDQRNYRSKGKEFSATGKYLKEGFREFWKKSFKEYEDRLFERLAKQGE